MVSAAWRDAHFETPPGTALTTGSVELRVLIL